MRNRFDGQTVLRTMTDDYLDLQLTASCCVEMKLLPVADSVSYICMVHTYSSPEKESVVTLYTQDWKPLPADKYLTPPAYKAFWTTNDTIDVSETERLQRLQDMHFVTAELSRDSMLLTFRLQPGVHRQGGIRTHAGGAPSGGLCMAWRAVCAGIIIY